MNIIQHFLNETYSYIKQKSKISGYGMFAQWNIDKEREKFLRGKGYLKPTEVRFDYAGN